MRLHFTLVAIVAVELAGCGRQGPNLAEVEGMLTLRGEPFPNVTLCFVPDAEGGTLGPASTGVTDEKGHYKLVCEVVGKPGALVGRHEVLVLDSEGFEEPPEVAGAETHVAPISKIEKKSKNRPRFAAKYMIAGQTPLHAEVRGEGAQVIDFNVE